MKKREKILLSCSIILAGLVVVFFAVIVYTKFHVEEDKEFTSECTTRYCVEAAAQLLEYVDLKEDPCKNFYRFACGSFYKNAVKKDTPSPWTSTGELFQKEMKSLVVDPVRKKDTNAHILLKQFYHECMNETKIDEDDNKTFMKSINELGGWPLINETWKSSEFNWVEWYIEAKRMGLPVIGLFSFRNMRAENDTTILKISSPHLTYETFHYPNRYKKLMKKITEAFGGTFNETENEEVNKFTKKLYHFSDSLDTDIVEDGSGPIYLNIQNLTNICPFIPWLKILNGISLNSTSFRKTHRVAFHVDNMKKYCSTLETLLNTTDPKVIANFYIWSIIEKAHKFMNKDIRGAYQDLVEGNDDRFKTCFDAADERFKYVKESIYVRKQTKPEAKAQLVEMMDILKDLYIEHLRDCDWMDENTKNTAMRRARSIKSIIGARDDLYDVDEFDKFLGVDGFKFTSDNIFKMLQEKLIKEDAHLFTSIYGPAPFDWRLFFRLVCEVNVLFIIQPFNTMIIPAPILTSIFFNIEYPAFMNYGSMGRTIANQLMYGFTKPADSVLEDESFYDWWSASSKIQYDNKVQCIVDEYESIPFRNKLNGTEILEESVADYVGADIGFEAYQRYVKKHGAEMKIPGVPLTPEQIYWVQASASSCFRKLDENAVDYEKEDDYAIPEFRIQAPARNSYHFAKAFNCPSGSFMNPEKKCRIL